MAGRYEKPNFDAAPVAPAKLRLDKWLFAARFFKSRERAIALIEEGHLRLNGVICTKPAHGVGLGDVLTFVQAGRVRVIRVTALTARRGPAVAAQNLYLDLDVGLANPPDLA